MRRVAMVLVTVVASTFLAAPVDAAYPPAGGDAFDSSAQVFVSPLPPELGGCDPANPLAVGARLEGPTEVRRGDPYELADGRMRIDTEIVAMSLTGGPVTISQHSVNRSLGNVTQQDAGQDYPADSSFGVYVEVRVGTLLLENAEPVPMRSVIYSLPPHAFPYLPPPGTCIPLRVMGTPGPAVLWLTHAEHLPDTHRECFPAAGALTVLDSTRGIPYNAIAVGTAQFVRGDFRGTYPVVDTEMIQLSLTGDATSDGRNFVPFSLTELPRTGSPGRLTGPPPTFDSFFDVFHQISLDGIASSRMFLFGNYDPVAGGMLRGYGPAGGRFQIVDATVSLGLGGPCPDDYPPHRRH